MTAKQMFEELGFEQVRNDGFKIVYDNGRTTYISFRVILPNSYVSMQNVTTVNIHKAIHQQMIELGWI